MSAVLWGEKWKGKNLYPIVESAVVWGEKWKGKNLYPIVESAVLWGEKWKGKNMYPIVESAVVWGEKWKGKTIIFYCDNEVTVHITNKGRSKVQPIMRLMRHLTWCAASGN